MKNKTFYSLLSLFSVLIIGLLIGRSQISPQKNIVGVWVGSHAELDKDVYIPHPYLLHFEKDSVQQIYLGEPRNDKMSWEWTGISLKIDTNIIQRNDFNLKNDQLSFGATYPRNYIRPKGISIFLNKEEITAILAGSNWQANEGIYQFKENGKALFQAHPDRPFRTYCWSIFELESYYFLNIYGNAQDCIGFPHFTEQIIEIDNSKLKTRKWREGKTQTLTYKMTEDSSLFEEAQNFQKCNPYLYRNYPRHRYYYQDTRYNNGGLYRIKKLFKENYKAIADENADGLIRVLFVVNCHGQAGEFEVLELDNDYKPKKFSEEISSQILDFCKDLQDWIPAENDQSQAAIDSYKYISFRLRDGEVYDIFP